MISQRTTAIAVCTVIGLFAVVGAGASSQRTAQLDPVAQEIRDLRFAVERAAAVSVQVSLLSQRTNAAQNKVSSFSSELADVRSQLARASAEMIRYNAVVAEFERTSAAVKARSGVQYPGFASITEARAQWEGQRQLEQSLRQRESELTAALNREQAQLSQLAAKLEALERSVGGQRD